MELSTAPPRLVRYSPKVLKTKLKATYAKRKAAGRLRPTALPTCARAHPGGIVGAREAEARKHSRPSPKEESMEAHGRPDAEPTPGSTCSGANAKPCVHARESEREREMEGGRERESTLHTSDGGTSLQSERLEPLLLCYIVRRVKERMRARTSSICQMETHCVR